MLQQNNVRINHNTGSVDLTRAIMSSLFSAPKVPALPPEPKEEDVSEAARRQRRNVQRGQVQTVFTSGQGARTVLGGN